MTALDCYEMVVGCGKCSPEYFLDKMQMWEIRRYINGIRRSERIMWETQRWHAWMIISALGGKIERPIDILQFPWEKEPVNTKEDEEQLKALIEACRKENAGM